MQMSDSVALEVATLAWQCDCAQHKALGKNIRALLIPPTLRLPDSMFQPPRVHSSHVCGFNLKCAMVPDVAAAQHTSLITKLPLAPSPQCGEMNTNVSRRHLLHQPVHAMLQANAILCRAALYLPGFALQGKQAQALCNFMRRHGSLQVLLVGKDEQWHLSKCFLLHAQAG